MRAPTNDASNNGSNNSPATQQQQVMDDIRRLVQFLRVSAAGAERAVGLSGAQLFVLHHLANSPFLSVNQLAEATRTHQSSVSVVATKLVERGLVTRRTSADDARRAELSITASGRRLLKGAPDTAQSRMIDAFDAIPRKSLKQLADSLRQLIDTLGLTGPAPMLFEDERPAGARKPAARRKPATAPKARRA